MATPKKLPSGNWRIQVFSHKENGKNKYVSFTAPTKAEANRLAAEFQANKSYEASPQSITIGMCVDNYIKGKTNILSPSTLKEYKGYKKYFYPIENIMLGSIQSSDLQNFVNALSATKNPKTVRNIYSLLLSSIRLYSDRNFRVSMPQKRVIERHIPTDADLKNLLNNANITLKKAILLSSAGTLRRGEICALKYKDILYDFNAVYVHSDMVLGESGWVHKEMPKTDSSTRRVVLPKEIIEILGHGEDEDYVVPVKPSTITTDFINLRNRLGLKFTFHSLRHYAASILHSIGIPDVYIMERGGWGSDTILKSVYRNSLSDKVSHFTTIGNEYFENNIMSKEISHEIQHGNQDIQ